MLQNIEAERARLRYTQNDIASALGISPKTYSSYVRGERAIPSDKLIKMSQLFHCSTDYLLGLSPQPRDRAG